LNGRLRRVGFVNHGRWPKDPVIQAVHDELQRSEYPAVFDGERATLGTVANQSVFKQFVPVHFHRFDRITNQDGKTLSRVFMQKLKGGLVTDDTGTCAHGEPLN
jgi:hypothetical protein